MIRNFSSIGFIKQCSFLLTALLSFSFSFAQTDVTRPTVVSVSPENWSITINSGITVSAVFSEAMNASTINGSTFELRDALNNTLVAATVTYNSSTRTATLYPTTPLTNSFIYSAKIESGSAGVKDLAGNALANDYTWYFIVIPLVDMTAPTVLSVTPANGATGVSVNTTVTAVLSELLMPSSVSASTVELRNASNVLIPSTVTHDVANRLIRITPASALATSTLYRATIKGGSSGVKDASGNALPSNYTWSFTTASTGGDVTPPTVISVSPLNGATGVSVSTTVSAIFNEAMNASTISSSTIQLRNAANTLITATVSYNTTTRTATLTPSAALSGSTVYTATITGGASGVKDAAGNALVNNYTWSFTTADITPPTVTSVSPLNGAAAVSVSTAVSAIFSEAMNASTVSSSTIQLRNAANTLITATVTYNAATNTATLTPSVALASSTAYTATITGGASGVKDATGNALVNNYTWSFTTADVIPPTITSVSPLNGATGVNVSTTVSAIFSEAMNASTISSSTIQLRNAANTLITATVSYNATSRTATLTPSAALSGSTVYTVTITAGASGVKDAAGNALVNNYTWSFTTADNISPTITSVSPLNGATGVSVSTTVSAIFSETMNASTISSSTTQLRNAANTLITATVSYNATTRTVTLTPSAALPTSTVYTATITGGASGVKDAIGNALVNNYTWSFTTAAPPDMTAPTVTSVSPLSGATGVSVSTTISAIFSETMNASTISNSTIQLRNAANTLITSTVSYNATTRTATLTPSAALSGSTVYTATITGGGSGVKDAAGNALVNNYTWSFTTADITPPTVTSVSPLNGATAVSVSTAVSAIFSEVMNASNISSSTIQLRNAANTLITATVTYNATTRTVTLTPSATLTSSTVYTVTITGGASGVKDAAGNALVNNYTWSFTTTDVIPPAITSVSPLNAATGVSIGTSVTAIFSEAMNASTISSSTIQLRNAANTLITAVVTYGAGTNTATLTPSALLTSSTVYTATITGGASGVKDAAGNALVNNYTWTFTTAVTNTIFQPTDVPLIEPVVADQPAEVGVKFRSAQSGYIAGIRFYKGAGHTGTHIGHLWSSTGIMLGEATFTNETASGWQQVLFSTPVAISANSTYIASYFSSAGHYCYTNSYFTSAVVNGPLRALAEGEDGSNGVYIYTGVSAFPTNSYGSSNYYADVVFTANTTSGPVAPAVISVSPLNGATGVNVSTAVTSIFSEAMDAATISNSTIQLRNAANTLITATVTYNAATRTATLTPSAALASSTVYTATITGGASGVKNATGNAMVNNYTWSFTTAVPQDVTAPVVTTVSPLNLSTGISVSTAVSAIFSEAMNASTISSSTIQLRNAANTLIPAAVTYNAATRTVILIPSAALTISTVYTATIAGGASGVKDAAGNALLNNYTWTFTTGANAATNTILQPTDVPSVEPVAADQPAEVGVKFRSAQSGYITGIRFYKGVGHTGTHIGHLWSSTGMMLGEATFTNETASGWQQVLFSTPIAINANTTYIASYFSSAGYYCYTNSYFTSAVVNGPLRGLANGEDGSNGVYIYTGVSAFPTNSFGASNYYADVVFTAGTISDPTTPAVISVSPANGATGVSTGTGVSAVFNELLNTSTVNSSTFELRNASGALVAATISYNAASLAATLTPSSALAYYTTYTAKIKGGAAGVKDMAGNALPADYTWTFTVQNPVLISPTEGPGGPILVISTTTNPFSRYAVEILRAEGLNEFAASDISAVTPTVLNNYDVAVLGEMTVTVDQVTMLTNWVNAGGTLIAFRPSSLLTPLLGISAASGTLADKYLLVNTASGPGAGIVNQTIQFHGTANRHTLNGATSIATLYSSATVATTNPAVTTRSVGTNGGRAIAFTYDLARSIIYTRQGNPAWAGQKRDGQVDPIRSDDMFFPDWIDFNKIAIPQADEQQRLLANIILQGNLHRKPLPRFWYLPRDLKAAIVMTGDDHNVNGTVDRFNQYLTLGPNTAQDITDWKAVRGTSYMYPATPITNAQAAAFEAQGFEIALHPNTGCVNFTPASLQADFTAQLALFNSAYPGVSSPVTNRTHCLVWSDWATQPKTEFQKGIRLDATYYYWPEVWMQNRPGMFTGSGMPMRFADIDGSLIDVYQAPTQMTDETNMDYTTFCNEVLDKAIGPEGYYGVFTANMHTDANPSEGSDAIIASAQARQVPIISAKQMLTWLDGRNNSSFGNMTWSNNQLTFTATVLISAANLKAMLPLYAETGELISIKKNGNSVPFTTQMIKGIQYAFFPVTAGVNTYVADYGPLNLRIANSVTKGKSEQAVTTEATTEATTEVTTEDKKTMQVKVTEAAATAKLYVNVMPNPSTSYFNMIISSNDADPVTVRVMDMFGRLIEIHERITSTGILRLGHSWRSGTYFAEVLQGDRRKVVKIIKAN